MFIRNTSPKGGRKLAAIECWERVRNIVFKPRRRPVVIEDRFSICIGWAEKDIKKGDKILLEIKEARRLHKLTDVFLHHRYILEDMDLSVSKKLSSAGLGIDDIVATLIGEGRLSPTTLDNTLKA